MNKEFEMEKEKMDKTGKKTFLKPECPDHLLSRRRKIKADCFQADFAPKKTELKRLIDMTKSTFEYDDIRENQCEPDVERG